VSVGVDAISDRVPAARILPVLDALEAAYGPRVRQHRLSAIDELVATILSQNTSDVNTDRAFAGLRSRFAGWDDVAAAPTAEVVDAIRVGGLANQKGPRIQAVLRELAARPEGYALEGLARLPVDEAMERLTSLPGVGKKTASCVLLFSLDMPVMPVDTHVLRVSRRLGWAGPGATADRVHEILTAAVPPHRMLSAHLVLIEHGRRTCRAPRPRCGECAVARMCPSAFQVR
jgi:endonuclease III